MMTRNFPFIHFKRNALGMTRGFLKGLLDVGTEGMTDSLIG
jgi:hypothetical protein